MSMQDLISKIKNKEASISIVGLGYVGLPLLLRFYNSGFSTIGIDIDESKILSLNNRTSYLGTVSNEEISNLDFSRCIFDYKFDHIKNSDIIILCVPTPLDVHREPDLSFIKDTLFSIRKFVRPLQALCLESTTYPGTTEEIICPFIESLDYSIGSDYFIIYSPEREDPGNTNFQTFNIPKVCSGVTDNCLKIGSLIYKNAVSDVVAVSSVKVAEMTKLLENIHRAVNIGLINEMKMVCDKIGIDIYEVIEAAKTKPFGFTPYYPGPGIGGHCIPVDPFYLTWKAREYGVNTKFIELAGEINSNMPHWVVNKVSDYLNDFEISLKSSRILVLGVSYKPDVDDTRESPSIKVIDLLLRKQANVEYHDPHVEVLPTMRKFNIQMKSINLSTENIKKQDCVLILTHHSSINYNSIAKIAKLVVDTRGVFKFEKRKNVLNA